MRRAQVSFRACAPSKPTGMFLESRGIDMHDVTVSLPGVTPATGKRRLASGPSADLEDFTSRARIAESARCSPWRRGNAVDLLVDGEQIFDAMFAAIAAARRSILLETYMLEAAGPGQRLAELLA